MIDIEKYFNKEKIFDTLNENHRKFFKNTLKGLTKHHIKNCKDYRNFFKILNFDIKNIKEISDLPFLPARIFKNKELKSINDKDIFKTLLSSGTSAKERSKIYLDKKNSNNQIKVLSKILSSHFGKKRMPMLVIDKNPSYNARSKFSASTAAIYGFSIFAKKQYFLINEKNQIDHETLDKFLKEISNENFLIFGFTYNIYEYLLRKISDKNYNLKNGILIHGGGWKKLEKFKISNNVFKSKITKKLGIKKIHNYYGLVEQTGSIFLECENGYFVTSVFSDILIRNKNFELLPNGSKGLIQLLSILPTSYPGHNLITEDIGEIYDGRCKCNLNGKHFLVHGRAKEAEIRGCSDTS